MRHVSTSRQASMGSSSQPQQQRKSARTRTLLRHDTSQAEVADAGVATCVDQHILRLQVPVDHATPVQVRHALVR